MREQRFVSVEYPTYPVDIVVKRRRAKETNGAAQLDGALALLGANNDVATYDNTAFAHRAGELIAKAVGRGEQMQIRLPRARRGRDVKLKSES